MKAGGEVQQWPYWPLNRYVAVDVSGAPRRRDSGQCKTIMDGTIHIGTTYLALVAEHCPIYFGPGKCRQQHFHLVVRLGRHKLSSTSHVRYGVFLFQALLQCTSLRPVAFGGKLAEVVGSRGLARFQRRKKQTRVIGGRLHMNHYRCMHEERRRCMQLKEPSCGRYQGFYRTHLLASPTGQSQIHRHDNYEKSSHFIARSDPRR